MNNDILISIVSPVYGCKTCLYELYWCLVNTLEIKNLNFEIIFVNDASPDNAWEIIEQIAHKDKRIKGINLSRNFGQHYAITAGLHHAIGEWIVVMDCDLQDRPEEIPNLYNKACEGYDSVFAQRIIRNDSFIKKSLSRIFYKLFSYLTETKQDPTVANFGIYHHKVIDAIMAMKDQIRYFPTMVQWVGFRKYYLPVDHAERFEGKTSYNFKSLMRLAINTIVAFSDKPLRLTAKLGFAIASISFCVGIFYLIRFLLGYIKVLGFASNIISIWFLSGIIIMILGMTGIYLGKVFEKVKDRPGFIITKKCNL